MAEEKAPGRLRRFGRGLLKVSFPSYWISTWAERKHKEIQNPMLAKLVEGLTYRKAYGFDEMREHVQAIREIKEQKTAERAARKHLSAEEAYRAMMQRNQFCEADRQRGMKNLRAEIRIAQGCMLAALMCVLGGAWFMSWPTVIMAALAFAYAWLKGLRAHFFLWQSECRACLSFSEFRRQGGVFKIFEW